MISMKLVIPQAAAKLERLSKWPVKLLLQYGKISSKLLDLGK
jgi:hypothetical protein